MQNNSIFSNKQLTLIEYLLSLIQAEKRRLPSFKKIGEKLGMSASCVREQMELARNLGLVKVQQKTGISILPYDFSPAIIKSLYFAIKSNVEYFRER